MSGIANIFSCIKLLLFHMLQHLYKNLKYKMLKSSECHQKDCVKPHINGFTPLKLFSTQWWIVKYPKLKPPHSNRSHLSKKPQLFPAVNYRLKKVISGIWEWGSTFWILLRGQTTTWDFLDEKTPNHIYQNAYLWFNVMKDQTHLASLIISCVVFWVPARFHFTVFCRIHTVMFWRRVPHRVVGLVDSDEEDQLGEEQGGYQVLVDAVEIGA